MVSGEQEQEFYGGCLHTVFMIIFRLLFLSHTSNIQYLLWLKKNVSAQLGSLHMSTCVFSKALMWRPLLPGKPGESFTHPLPSHRDLGSDTFCHQPVLPILHPPALPGMMWWTQAGTQGSQFLHQAEKERPIFFIEISILTKAKPTQDREESGLDLCLST